MSLWNQWELSLVRLSHRNGLKTQKISKISNNFQKQIIEAIKTISYYLNIVYFQFGFHLY